MAMEEDGGNTVKFLKHGLHVDGSSVGMLSVDKSDLHVIPEEDTFLTIQIGGNDNDNVNDFCHHRFLAHLVQENGDPHPLDPRGILKKLVEKANNDMGLEPYMFSEIEFYIVHEQEDGSTTPVDDAGYCYLPPRDKCYDFRHELGTLCKKAGMNVKRIHHENGRGQNEIELGLEPCLKNADDTVLCMWLLDMLAAKRHQKILFSPKPFHDDAGNGLHHHVLLRDKTTGENVFMNHPHPAAEESQSDNNKNTDRASKLSDTCKHGIAGLLKYADEITAVFAGSHESFVRLLPGYEAPSVTAWDFSNRTALVRVPQTDDDDMLRFEYRGGDLSGSVHLFGAILLAAVLQGIQDKLELPPNANFNVEKAEYSEEELASRFGIRSVPKSIEECLQVLKTSEFLKDALGPEMVQVLIERDEQLLLEK